MPKLRKMLNDWNAAYIQSLVKLIETQSKTTLANWAVDYARNVMLPLWNKYDPQDLRPQSALDAADDWLSGSIQPIKCIERRAHAYFFTGRCRIYGGSNDRFF